MTILESFKKWASRWGKEIKGDNIAEVVSDFADNLPFGTKTEIEYVELYSTTDWLAGSTFGNETNIYSRSIPDGTKINFIAGKKYTVNVSGKEFTFIAETVDVNGTEVIKIGADLISLYEADFSVHKFAMYTSSARTTTIWHDDLCLHNFMPELSASAHGISLKVCEVEEVEVVQQLDPKFVGGINIFEAIDSESGTNLVGGAETVSKIRKLYNEFKPVFMVNGCDVYKLAEVSEEKIEFSTLTVTPAGELKVYVMVFDNTGIMVDFKPFIYPNLNPTIDEDY